MSWRWRSVPIAGKWRIVDMELWAPEDVDLVDPAYIEFGVGQTGSFRFIAVEAQTDWRATQREERPAVEFTWEGSDEGDRTSGRGWAILETDGSLSGRLYFHLGDDSAFRAVPADHEAGSVWA
jgi:hypothetical protein